MTGIAIDINLRFVKGEIKLYIKNKDEVWLHLELTFSFGKRLEKDVRVLILPDPTVVSAAYVPAHGLQQGNSTNATSDVVAA